MFNIVDPIKYSAGKKKRTLVELTAHLSLKIFFLHLKQSSWKIMVLLDGMWWFGTTLYKNPTGCRTSGCGEDFGISKTFWTLRHCPGAVWKPDFLFKSPQPPCTPCQICFLKMHFYREENGELFGPLPPPPFTSCPGAKQVNLGTIVIFTLVKYIGEIQQRWTP